MDIKKATNLMHDLMRLMVSMNGTDLFITADSPPAIKVGGKMTLISKQVLSARHTQQLSYAIMNQRQLAEFEASQECNFSIMLPNVSRFRVNAFIQRGSIGLVLRIINSEIPSFDDLGLPEILSDMSMTKRGLIIFIGNTGSGKSTSLASMVNYRNKNDRGHIVTVEDPIEFIHEHINCLVTQREIGVDTDNYAIALKNTLRQSPDVILIGEVRDRETMEQAIIFAETGHLCLTTLHANNANQAIDRIINFFPDERRAQLLMDLSLNLKGLISQRLVPKIEGGLMPAVEVMLNTPLMSDLIFKGKIHHMKALMAKSNNVGMKTFDQALFELYETKKITFEDALRNADSVNDLRLRIKLESETARDSGLLEDNSEFQLIGEDDADQADISDWTDRTDRTKQ